MKVYNSNGKVCAHWLNKLSCQSLRFKMGGFYNNDIENMFRNNRVPTMPIEPVDGRWYLDAGEDLGSFMYESEELAKADKATLLTIIAEAF